MKREMEVVLTVLAALGLGLLGFVAFTGFVAYCGLRPIQEAYQGPPLNGRSAEPMQLGAYFDAGLSWAMRVCGSVVILVGAAMVPWRTGVERQLPCIVLVLAGAVLITQHWAAAIAVSLFGIALILAPLLRQPTSEPTQEVLPTEPPSHYTTS